MNRMPLVAVYGAGLLAIAWVGAGYAGTHALALSVLLLIAGTYLVGGLELRRFSQANSSLARALSALATAPPALDGWLAQIDPALRQPVRLRIEGDRHALPAPAVTPYLVGLLVLLGMIGTFLGMVVTLNGTVSALQGTQDLQAMRASLAAPVRGLGLAFGTSVAGICASAALGLVSVLCRRERWQLSQALDQHLGSTLHTHTRAYQRQQGLESMQAQAGLMPAVVDRLQQLMERLDQQNLAWQQQLLAQQQAAWRQAEVVHTQLAASVDRSLQHTLAESARLAAAAIAPTVSQILAGIERDMSTLHTQAAHRVQAQLDGVCDQWREALATTQAASTARDEQRLEAFSAAMKALSSSLQQHWRQAGEQALAQQQALCRTLADTAQQMGEQAQAQASRTIAEVTQLMQVAAEAPRAAADIIVPLRQQLSDSLARDNALLEERSRIMATLAGLLDSLQQASAGHRNAIDALVVASAQQLDAVQLRFAETVSAESDRLGGVAAQVTGSAAEVASLGEAFGLGVQRFAESNERLMDQLQRIEASLDRSSTRSDEQLAYYVAQARELIDLSISSQQQVIGELRQAAAQVL